MKTWLNHLYILGVLSIALFSCKKDEERIVLKEGSSSSLLASTTTLVLNKANASDTIVSFTTNPADYGYQAAVNYTLEMDVKGNNFANAKTVDLGSRRVKKYTVAELNSLLNLLKLAPGTPGQVEVRTKSVLSVWVNPTYSSVVTLTVTPYEDVVEYPSLYVPGGYQGWAPAAAAKVASVKDDKNYEGYVYFQEASEFKFTNGPNWDGTNYGDAGAGKLSSDGGAGNLKVNTPGYYRLNVNLDGLTWSATKTAWGVIGNATGSWDVDKDMTYDPTEKVWKATLNLSTGEIKFRANDDWGINFGDAKPADGKPEYGGDNIAITEAGTYDIILDLSKPGNYSYSVTKK
jgi:hypothetical protein